MFDNLNDNQLVRLAFGWNYKCWSHAFRASKFQLPNRLDRILEIGASRYSMVSLIFDGLANEIVISYYTDDQREGVEQYLASVGQRYNLKSKYVFCKCMGSNYGYWFEHKNLFRGHLVF